MTPLYPTIQPRSARKAAATTGGTAGLHGAAAAPTAASAPAPRSSSTTEAAPQRQFVPLYPTIRGRRSKPAAESSAP